MTRKGKKRSGRKEVRRLSTTRGNDEKNEGSDVWQAEAPIEWMRRQKCEQLVRAEWE